MKSGRRIHARLLAASLMTAGLWLSLSACSSSSSVGVDAGPAGKETAPGAIPIPTGCGTFNGTTGLFPDGGIEIGTCSEFYGLDVSAGADSAVGRTLGAGGRCPITNAESECLQVVAGPPEHCTTTFLYPAPGVTFTASSAEQLCKAQPGATTFALFVSDAGALDASSPSDPCSGNALDTPTHLTTSCTETDMTKPGSYVMCEEDTLTASALPLPSNSAARAFTGCMGRTAMGEVSTSDVTVFSPACGACPTAGILASCSFCPTRTACIVRDAYTADAVSVLAAICSAGGGKFVDTTDGGPDAGTD